MLSEFKGGRISSELPKNQVFNSTYAHLLLGERLKWTEVVVMSAMVVGAVLVVSVTPVSTAKKVAWSGVGSDGGPSGSSSKSTGVVNKWQLFYGTDFIHFKL